MPYPVLRPWINANDPKDTKKKRKFIIKRDPRNISKIHFYDPEIKEYFEIPYRNTSHPPLSIWELRETQKFLKKDGFKDVDDNKIFEAYEKMREMEEQAVKETKKVRRENQRRKFNSKQENSIESLVSDFPSISPNEIEPYEVEVFHEY